MSNSPEIEKLVKLISKLPGLGQRSARRALLHLLKHKEDIMLPLANSIVEVADALLECELCGNFDTSAICSICSDDKRDSTSLCIVEEVLDLWAFERSSVYKGVYHVLGGTLSAIDGRGPDALRIDVLVERVGGGEIKEVIIATNATVEGQTTAHYLAEKLSSFEIEITRLAHGIPIGGELDYLDDGTLGAALKSRRAV